jgi:hypothetical protein
MALRGCGMVRAEWAAANPTRAARSTWARRKKNIFAHNEWGLQQVFKQPAGPAGRSLRHADVH